MFTQVKTSKSNKEIVTDLTHKLNLGAENVIARVALTYSLSKSDQLNISSLRDSQGKEYSKNVLFGNLTPFYIALICTKYNLYKTDKDIPKYVKAHLDDGLELLYAEFKDNPNLTGFDYLVDKIEEGLKNM